MSAFDSLQHGAHPAVDHNENHECLPTLLDEEYERPISPLQMPPGQIDGLESLKAKSYLNGGRESPVRRHSSNNGLLHLDIRGFPSPAEIAMSAMQYLPYPLIVLNNLKALAMANEAMLALRSRKLTHNQVQGSGNLECAFQDGLFSGAGQAG